MTHVLCCVALADGHFDVNVVINDTSVSKCDVTLVSKQFCMHSIALLPHSQSAGRKLPSAN